MRNAQEAAPKKCLCGRRLGKPQYGKVLNCRSLVWYIICACHTTYVWSWHPASNGCWKVRDDLPLFDSRQVIAIA